jgi:hypothetical protein
MKINRDNYEAYFLDYHEGLLSPEMVKEVLLFVELNPDLKKDFTEFEAVSLQAETNIVFEKKSSLKKNQIFATSAIYELNYEEYLVAECEGLLTDEQLALLDEFISINPQFEKDRKLFALAHLPVPNEIIFEAKDTLKQKAIPAGLITAETFETYMARELEGDLNADESLQFAEFMKFNPSLEADRKQYAHTILIPDSSVVFPNKKLLKQSVTPIRSIVWYALSAAASLALIFSVYFLLNRSDIPQSIANQGQTKNINSIKRNEPVKTIPQNQVATIAKMPDKTSLPISNAQLQNQNTPATSNTVNNSLHPSYSLANRTVIQSIEPRTAHEITNRQYVDPQFTFIRVSQMYMNKNLEFYYNIKLAEEIQYAQLNSKDKNPIKTIYNGATEKVGELFAFNRVNPPKEESKNLSLWTFAELGVQTFNSITSSELELNLHKDDEGKVVGYNIESGLIDFEREIKK